MGQNYRYTKGSFVVVPNKHVLVCVSASAQAVYLWIASYANEEGVCFPSVKTLSTYTQLSRRKIFMCLKELEDVLLLTRINRVKDNKKITNIYQLNLIDDAFQSFDGVDRSEDLNSAPHALPSAQYAHRTQSTELNINNKGLKPYGEYKHVLLSDEDKNKLKEKFGVEKCLKLVKMLDEGIELKGYKYKNHYLAIINWEKRDREKNTKFISNVYDKARKLEKIQQAQDEERIRKENEDRNERVAHINSLTKDLTQKLTNK